MIYIYISFIYIYIYIYRYKYIHVYIYIKKNILAPLQPLVFLSHIGHAESQLLPQRGAQHSSGLTLIILKV